MPRAVCFDRYGPLDVLQVVEVERPVLGPGEVLVEVVSAGINPGEPPIREGQLHEIFPATFPSGEGSDFAGHVVEIGADVTNVAVGDEVLGYSHQRSSHADYVAVAAGQVTSKPAGLGWDEAGGLFVAGTTAYAAVRAIAPQSGETVAVSAAAGAVGLLSVQLLRRAGARVIGIAGPDNQDYLSSLGATPVVYGDGLADRLHAAAPNGIDGFIDAFGAGYVELAIELGVPADRINTVVDFIAAQQVGAKTDGSMSATDIAILAELAALLASGELSLPIAARYPLDRVQDAFIDLAGHHARGKIVLRPQDSR